MKKLVRLLKNRPAMVAVTTAVVAIGARVGLDVDAELVAVLVAAGVTVVTAMTVTERKAKKRAGVA